MCEGRLQDLNNGWWENNQMAKVIRYLWIGHEIFADMEEVSHYE